MKVNYLIKLIPFLSTLLLIILLNINNQKENTKLTILIWDTPSLSLGNYLAISIGSGFLISYLITNILSTNNQLITNKTIKYKIDNKHENENEFNELNTSSPYEKTLIEREFKEPSPTLNASFRVIGKIEKNNSTSIKNSYNKNQYIDSNQLVDQYYEMNEKYESKNPKKSLLSDWYDESYSNW